MAKGVYHTGGECTAKELQRQREAEQNAWKKSRKQAEMDQKIAMQRQGIKTVSLLDLLKGIIKPQ